MSLRNFPENSDSSWRKPAPHYPRVNPVTGRLVSKSRSSGPLNQRPGTPDDHYTELRHAPRQPVDISQMTTGRLMLSPVPNITPKRGAKVEGKREYVLKLPIDFAHGGFHATIARLGVDGSGEVIRGRARVHPINHGIEYVSTTMKCPLDFEELIQLAACACDARGISWADACRFIAQSIRDTGRDVPPDEPDEGA